MKNEAMRCCSRYHFSVSSVWRILISYLHNKQLLGKYKIEKQQYRNSIDQARSSSPTPYVRFLDIYWENKACGGKYFLVCIYGCVYTEDSRPTQAAKVAQFPWGHEEGNRVFHRTFLDYKSDGNFKGHLLNASIMPITHHNKLQ